MCSSAAAWSFAHSSAVEGGSSARLVGRPNLSARPFSKDPPTHSFPIQLLNPIPYRILPTVQKPIPKPPRSKIDGESQFKSPRSINSNDSWPIFLRQNHHTRSGSFGADEPVHEFPGVDAEVDAFDRGSAAADYDDLFHRWICKALMFAAEGAGVHYWAAEVVVGDGWDFRSEGKAS